MRAKPQPRCIHCGKHRGQHSREGAACPALLKELALYGAWRPTHTFTPPVRPTKTPHPTGGSRSE